MISHLQDTTDARRLTFQCDLSIYFTPCPEQKCILDAIAENPTTEGS